MIWKIYAQHLYSVRLHPMKFDHSFHDRKQASSLGVPFAWSPKGYWVFIPKELPFLPIPSYVHVAVEYIEFDGWVFPIREIKKAALNWMRESIYCVGAKRMIVKRTRGGFKESSKRYIGRFRNTLIYHDVAADGIRQ
jgi:hypothetical protein